MCTPIFPRMFVLIVTVMCVLQIILCFGSYHIFWHLDLWSRAGFWKSIRATVHAVRKIQYSLFQSCMSWKKHEDCIISFRKLSFP
jgi:hypothetical protein